MVVIKVKIGLKSIKGKTSHGFPDFNSIRDNVASWDDGSDWSHFVDRFGGWHYDGVAGHNDEDSANGSPRGVWLGMLIVPSDFAEEAVKAFPEQVSVIAETDAQGFYENRVTADQSEIIEDVEALQAIAAKKSLGIEDAADVNSLNPDHPQRGRRRNKTKTWAGYKQQRGIEIDAAATQRLRNNP